MKFTLIRLAVFVLCCFSFWFTVRKFKENGLGLRSTLVWLLLIAAIGLSSLFPELPDFLSPLMGMGNRMFFVLLVGMLVLYGLLFNVTSRLDRIERNIRRLTQERALAQLGEGSVPGGEGTSTAGPGAEAGS